MRTLAGTARVARPAIRTARPTVAQLNTATTKVPELANNLEFVLRDLDDRGRAVEKDKRSPGGQGYTGFEAFLSYVFDQMMAINVFDENGHILKVNLSASECSDYQNADSLRRQEKLHPGFTKRCLAALGPNQPGVTTPDPSDTGADDPGPGANADHLEPPRQGRGSVARRRPGRAATRPASRTSGRPSTGCCAAAAGGTRRRRRRRTSTRPRGPPTPSAPNVSTGSSTGGQSADPQALLDYLLSP